MDKVSEELVAENLELNKTINSLQEELTKAKEVELAYSFKIVEMSDKGITIRGVLLAEGVWKGLKWGYDKIKNYIMKFKGAPIMKDHGHDPMYGNTEGGRITKISLDDTLKCAAFEAKITNPQFIELVKNERVDAISPKGMWQIDESNGEVVGCTAAIEASLTSSPACEFCNIFSFELSNYMERLNNSLDANEYIVELDDVEDMNFQYTEISLAVWTRAYINKLPDSAFAYISPGGKKDKEGKTVPRDLRHLPYKDATGKVDVPHLKNAISRAKQAKIPTSVQKRVMAKLQRLYKRIKG